MAFTFQFIVLYLVDFPTNWFAFVCLFGWLLLSVLFAMFFFHHFGNGEWCTVRAHLCWVSANMCNWFKQRTGKKSSKQNQRFKSIYVLSLSISLCMCLFIWRRDDALNILLLDKKKLFARLSWSKMHFSTAKWTLSNLHGIAASHAKRKQTNTLKQNTTQPNYFHHLCELFN